MAIKAAPLTNWLPGASASAPNVTIPHSAIVGTLMGATVTDDIRKVLIGILDRVYLQFQADILDDGYAPETFSVHRVVTADTVQFVFSASTASSNVTLPDYA